MATTEPADPLTMTDDEIAAITPTAEQAAADANKAVQTAELVLRGELAPAAGWTPQELTPARLAQLRAEAEHADLQVAAARRQTAQIRETRRRAEQAALLARIRTEGAADLGHATDLIAALNTLDGALRAFCEAAYAHNERVTYWAKQAGSPKRDEVTIGAKTWRHLEGGRLVGSVVYRAMHGYPNAFLRQHGPYAITHEGDPYGIKNMRERSMAVPTADLDLHDLIRKDA
ncbi:hypothetical protein [Streptomyces sp. AC512_CC834]|uniref:hypothetical protein n=1 Tax=Streptomyces sp. AC512_CC834 TaxID=2823691 RepID=UPI001C27334B|nr:hypothetical protein [Streptomyces sp. AC512_CC834]